MKDSLQQKEVICRFMRRKKTTKEMMKSYIVESLLILMKEKPFADITISDIVNRAGVNRSTYYRHFYTKEDIITYFFDNLMQEYMNLFKQKNSNPTFYKYLLTIFSTFFKHKEDLLTIHKAGLSHLYIIILNKWFQLHSPMNTVSNTKQFEIAYHIGGIYNHILLWLEHEMKESPDEMANMALSLRPDGALTLLNI